MPTVVNLGLKSDIRGVGNLGSWSANTSFKATFILQMLEKHQEDIIFVDADAEILEYPKLFEEIPEEYNFGAHILDRNSWYQRDYGKDRYELLSGTLFIRNNERSKEIIKLWVEECGKYPNKWEQKIFKEVLEKNKEKIYQLPLEYCYIKTLPDGSEPNIKCDRPVIVHNQVSRKLKQIVNERK
jgi:hypothetical protein